MPFLEKKSILTKPAIRPVFPNPVTYIFCIFVFVIFFFRWTSKILPASPNGQKEFPTLLAGRADQVLPLHVTFFLFFTRDNRILSRKKYIQEVEYAPRKLITKFDLSNL